MIFVSENERSDSDVPFFRNLREQKKIISGIVKSAKEEKKRQLRYIQMSAEDFAQLPENELFDAAYARTNAKLDRFENVRDGVRTLSKPQKVFFAASYYEMEVSNGGLCQFFVNSSRCIAPVLSECLQEIGADEHKALFDAFVSDNQIDVRDFSSFEIDDLSAFTAQTERYPFDEFDEAFYALPPLTDYLTAYVQKHISAF
ncbi:MAG: DUF4375 domain-containing protein [Clostridia bacterium]|nr:DUF4375 domain-containing protein [Clostridia bacterium]